MTIENHVLTIKGSIDDSQVDGYEPAWREYEPGAFERSFTVPKEIDVENISASVTDGVLRVTLPKSDEDGVRRIEVQAN